MSLNFSLIQDVYGCEYTELNRNSNKNKHNTSLEQEMVAESNRELQEMEAGIEGFANYQGGNSIDTGMAQIISEESFTRKPKKSKKNKKNNKNKLQRPKAVVPTAQQEEDSSSDEESDVESVENTNNNKKLVNENIQLKKQIDELDTKLNLLINKLNTDTKTNNKTETNNIYDIILFVIFGLFVLLLLESLTKLISKNIVKYEPSNAIKAIME